MPASAFSCEAVDFQFSIFHGFHCAGCAAFGHKLTCCNFQLYTLPLGIFITCSDRMLTDLESGGNKSSFSERLICICEMI